MQGLYSPFTKLIYEITDNPNKNISGFLFAEIHKLIVRCIWKCKRPRRSKTILTKQKNKVGEIYQCQDFYKDAIKTLWDWLQV